MYATHTTEQAAFTAFVPAYTEFLQFVKNQKFRSMEDEVAGFVTAVAAASKSAIAAAAPAAAPAARFLQVNNRSAAIVIGSLWNNADV